MTTIDPSSQSLNSEINESEIPSWFLKLNKLKANFNHIENESQFYEQFLTFLTNEETALELQYKNLKHIEKLEREIQLLEERYSKVMQSKLGKIIRFYWKLKRWAIRKIKGR
ncbi:MULTISPECIES: hypothetical protein [unclassified Bacillus (in: firmicutes)]|uniref:hypothetical protein n=1 Tax=unclassified Bacillus (in: firmicutes) TaxID=185979 RepID=UPI000BF1C33F|nr:MULTISPECIES: hypothetical protein [unclassified Bacillus (in: firmicutes)]